MIDELEAKLAKEHARDAVTQAALHSAEEQHQLAVTSLETATGELAQSRREQARLAAQVSP
jgi:hypothetical protein